MGELREQARPGIAPVQVGDEEFPQEPVSQIGEPKRFERFGYRSHSLDAKSNHLGAGLGSEHRSVDVVPERVRALVADKKGPWQQRGQIAHHQGIEIQIYATLAGEDQVPQKVGPVNRFRDGQKSSKTLRVVSGPFDEPIEIDRHEMDSLEASQPVPMRIIARLFLEMDVHALAGGRLHQGQHRKVVNVLKLLTGPIVAVVLRDHDRLLVTRSAPDFDHGRALACANEPLSRSQMRSFSNDAIVAA
jgi:hypothetical protein